MGEVNREYLIIPTEEELDIAFEDMKNRIMRASERGQVAKNLGDIGHQNANRILNDNEHLAEKLDHLSRSIGFIVIERKMSARDVYMAAAKDLLEILASATNYASLPKLDE